MKSLFPYKILFFLFLAISNLYANEAVLQYPEPARGWEEGDCQSNQIQSPIDIPSIKDNSILIDDGSHAKIKSLFFSNIFGGAVKYDKGHKWTTDELDIGYMEIYLNRTLYKYKLHSFHFHLYSEHRIENKQYPMEMHLVHKNLNKEDSSNENLVIAILFDYKDDKENKFLNDINLAEEKKINDASIVDLINKDDTFYYYKGSTTTIPCSMSFEQFNKFKNWVENSNIMYYGTGYGNARGPKKLNGRKIYLENFNEETLSNSKYWFSIFPITTSLMYPVIIYFFHMSIKK